MIKIINDKVQKLSIEPNKNKYISIKNKLDFENKHEIYAIYRCKNCGYKARLLLKWKYEDRCININSIENAIQLFNKYETGITFYYKTNHTCPNGDIKGLFEIIGFEEKIIDKNNELIDSKNED